MLKPRLEPCASGMSCSASAIAHPNVALVKYWGKAAVGGNVPATPSLSLTLDAFAAIATVREARRDSLTLNGAASADAKVTGFLQALREAFDLPPLDVDSRNDFPTGCGLASSAAGFAALATAVDAAFALGMGVGELSSWARRGSASAARSIVGGFGALRDVGDGWRAAELLPPAAWPLKVVVGITSRRPKAVSSTAGMERSRATSPFYEAWLASTRADYDAALSAIAGQDFAALARIAEASCLKMHGLALSSEPGLIYWNGATVEGMRRIRELRRAGAQTFFTADAGPQIKAVCTPDCATAVAAALVALPGVEAVTVSGLGHGARCRA